MSGSAVGQFPGVGDIKRRVIRAPVNPLDKSTIVSIFPKEINEVKHTIQPGRFIIPPGKLEKPAILVVGPSSWWREVDEDQPLLEIPVYSTSIAQSIIDDYCNGLLAFNGEQAKPGLFYVPGEFKRSEILMKYSEEIEKAKVRQDNWYKALVRLADSLWARSNSNPITISDDMRMAATELGVADTKDWMSSHSMLNMVRCHACGSLKSPEYPVCMHCNFIDETHPKAAGLIKVKGVNEQKKSE